MVKFSSFPAIAAVLCAVLLLSCTSADPASDESSSSSIVSSSSLVQPGSSSSVQISSSSLVVSSSSSLITIDDPDLIKKNITLSYVGNSYADIDGDITTYGQAEVASRLDKIDLIAHCGTNSGWCEENSIYTPFWIDLFWNDYDYLGGDVSFLEIPVAQAEVFKTATKRSEIISVYNSLTNIFDDIDNYLDEISIAIGKVFFVYTSEEKIRIVIIKATGNQSVDLEIIQIPD